MNCQNQQNRTSGTNIVIFPDLPNEIPESVVDVNPVLCGRLYELASKVLCEITTLCYDRVVSRWPGGRTCRGSRHTIDTDHSLMFQVTPVRDDYNGQRVLFLDAEDTLVEATDFLNGLT